MTAQDSAADGVTLTEGIGCSLLLPGCLLGCSSAPVLLTRKLRGLFYLATLLDKFCNFGVSLLCVPLTHLRVVSYNFTPRSVRKLGLTCRKQR